jgi:hypothetical protein
MTNSQKVAFYANAIAQMGAVSAANVEHMKSDYQAEESAFKAMLDAEVAAYKATLEKEQQATTFFSDLLTEHKTFGEEVKSIVNSWLKDYVDAMSKVLVPTTGAAGGGQSTSGFAQFFQGFFGGGAASSQTQSTTQFSGSVTKFQQAVDAFSRLSAPGGGAGTPASFSTNATDANNPAATTQWLDTVSTATYDTPIYVAESPGGAAQTVASYGQVNPAVTTGGAGIATPGMSAAQYAAALAPIAGDTMSSYFAMPASGSMQIGWDSSNASSAAPWGVGITAGAPGGYIESCRRVRWGAKHPSRIVNAVACVADSRVRKSSHLRGNRPCPLRRKGHRYCI